MKTHPTTLKMEARPTTATKCDKYSDRIMENSENKSLSHRPPLPPYEQSEMNKLQNFQDKLTINYLMYLPLHAPHHVLWMISMIGLFL